MKMLDFHRMGFMGRGKMLERLSRSALVLACAGIAVLARESGAVLPEGPGAPSAGALSDGFDPAGWTTNETYAPIGDLSAKKGGALRLGWTAFPASLRVFGPGSDDRVAAEVSPLVYEPLIELHPKTLEVVGRLATHWKVSPDGRTFAFHIDPRARWADGTPVTAQDVVATWEFRSKADLRDPGSSLTWASSFERPAAAGPGIVEVRATRIGWRLFAEFGSAPVLQAKELSGLDGERYLAEYDGKLLTGSGPYELAAGGLIPGASLTLSRRPGYWGNGERFGAGLYNFDQVSWTGVADGEAALQSLLDDKLDFLSVEDPRLWGRSEAKIRKGWIQKREIRTQGPRRLAGVVFNMRTPPFEDRNVRRAFALLWDRDRTTDRLFSDGYYKPLDSYFPGTSWTSSETPKALLQPKNAAKALAYAGWADEGGRLVKGGRQLEADLDYADPAWTQALESLRDDVEKAGFRLNLRLNDRATLTRKAGERAFTALLREWSVPFYPAPERLWDSRLADLPYSANVPGLKNSRVDVLMRQYDEASDREGRREAVAELDGALARTFPCALGWFKSSDRLLYWDKLGHPVSYLPRTGGPADIARIWWADPEKAAALETAVRKNKKLPLGPVLQDPWAGYAD